QNAWSWTFPNRPRRPLCRHEHCHDANGFNGIGEVPGSGFGETAAKRGKNLELRGGFEEIAAFRGRAHAYIMRTRGPAALPLLGDRLTLAQRALTPLV